MNKLLVSTSMIAGLLCSFDGQAANSPAAVDSKEYKVLLDPGRFTDPASGASGVLQALKTRLAELGFDKPVTGSFSAEDANLVSYYDTAGSCALRGNGYTVRTRDGENTIQFKYRHPDAELSAFTDVSGAGTNRKTKLETDVTPENLVYSNSTTQTLASSGAPTNVAALISQFPGASTLSAFSSQPLIRVNGLALAEDNYAGPLSDIGKSKAKFELALWYLAGSGTPALVELSFKVKADADAYFTTPVLQRSQTLMTAMSSLGGWNLTPSTTKVAWVYGYSSAAYPGGFCNP